jgi:hypothetical protein
VDLNFVRGQFTESQLESAVISLFQAQNYEYLLGETIHRGFEEILLEADLRSFLSKQYSDLTAAETDKVVGLLENIPSTPLYQGNRKAFLLVNEGFNLLRDDPSKLALHVNYIDFDVPENNIFKAVNQLVFTSEVVADFIDGLSDELIKIFADLQADKTSFEALGITYEEKAFYDILVKVRDDHGFPYADEKCLVLAKEIKNLVDDKAQFADWSTRADIKNQLNMDLTVLLYKNGYPPEWDEEVFEKVLEQAENFKKCSE